MCEQSTKIHQYHDGYLTAQSRAEVEAHLAECGECAALLDDLRRLSRVIAAAPRAELPAATLARLRAARMVAQDRGVLRIATGLTAAAAAVVLGMLLIRPTEQSEPRESTASAAVWQTRAVTPPEELHTGSTELVVVAQWMADELGSGTR